MSVTQTTKREIFIFGSAVPELQKLIAAVRANQEIVALA